MANALWSALNAAGGTALLGKSPSGPRERISLLAGVLAMTFFLAHYFGKSPQQGKEAAASPTVR